jgi:hypothetical protein
LEQVAQQAGATATRDAAREHIRDWQRLRLADVDRTPSPAAPEDVDRALLRDDLDSARRAAVSARVSAGYLALRAAALGRLHLSSEQAQLVLAADPNDPDALVAALTVADLEGDAATVSAHLMRLMLAENVTLSRLGAHLFAEVLSRRVSHNAAKLFRDAYPLGAPATRSGHSPPKAP